MKKVSFTEMKKGSREDYLFLDKYEKDFRDEYMNVVKLRLGMWMGLYEKTKVEKLIDIFFYNSGSNRRKAFATMLIDREAVDTTRMSLPCCCLIDCC